jgi:hypothetical protein
VLAVVLGVGACNLTGRALRWRPPEGGALWRDVRAVGALGGEVPESSGLAPSARHPGLFWTLNDSGNDAELVAIDDRGATRGRVRLEGVENRDWEAMGVGPCPAGRCVVVGDVGDNLALRSEVRLLRVAEPPLPAGAAPGAVLAGAVEQLPFRYPDGPRDVEALFVAPDSSVWVLTKRPSWRTVRAQPVRLYRLPASAWRAGVAAPVVAEAMGTLPVFPGRRNGREWVTDAALSALPPTGGGCSRCSPTAPFTCSAPTRSPGAPGRAWPAAPSPSPSMTPRPSPGDRTAPSC